MRIAICDSAGKGVMGDDCVRDIYVQHIHHLYPEVEILTSGPYPADRVIEDADLVIIAGLIKDGDQESFSNSFLEFAGKAVLYNKPFALIGVSFSDYNKDNVLVLSKILSKADCIGVLQRPDLAFIKEFNMLPTQELDLGSSVCYLINSSERVKLVADSNKRAVAIIPGAEMNAKDSFLKEKIKHCLLEYRNLYDFHIVPIAREDVAVADELQRVVKGPGYSRPFQFFDPCTVVSMLSEMYIVYTNRIHGIAFACSGGVKKIIGFGNDTNLLEELPKENRISSFSEVEFIEAIDTCSIVSGRKDPTHLGLIEKFIAYRYNKDKT
jgi:hypothetical protein